MTKLISRVLFFVLFSFIVFQPYSVVVADGQETSTVTQDIWHIDLHGVARSFPNEQNFARLRFYRWKNNCWTPSDADEFFQTQEPDVPLIVLTLGYSLTSRDVSRVGHTIVRTFNADQKGRIVFWDWFSDRGTCRIRMDIRGKVPIADYAGKYLALFLQSVKPESKVCLFGFSFGSRIVCQSVEDLQRSENMPENLRLHLVLSGAAMDQDWLVSGQRYGNVIKTAEKILVTYNPDDWVLRLYPLIYHLGHSPVALGLEGVPIQRIAPEFRSRIDNINVEPYMGSAHQTIQHVISPVFRSRVNEYFFFNP